MNNLKGKNLLLRAPEPEDLDLLYIWENDPEIWQVSNTITPFSRYVLKNYIENSHLDIFQSKQLRLMIELINPSITVGTIDLFDYDPYHNHAGIGILIGNVSERNKGYAGEALDILISYSFKILKLHQLYCNISADNISSIGLFKSKKFVKCGEKKEWLKKTEGWQSEFLFQLIRQ